MIVGDSPLVKTGFGRVNYIAAKRFQEEGWEVASVTGLDRNERADDEGIKLYQPSTPADVLGIRDMHNVVHDFKPDVIYATAEPGTAVALAMGIPDMPAFIYTPIEGEPIANRDWRMLLEIVPTMTCSKYGADLIKKTVGKDVEYVYHGIDHDVFQPNGTREDTRKFLGWEDKFVVSYFGTNVRRKQIPRLMEAVAGLIHKFGQKDIILYLHTVPFQNYWLEGWNLFEVSQNFGIAAQTNFNPHMSKFLAAVPERTDDPNNPGLVELLQASDLVVNPSQVEGFGFTPAEAMACGVPVLVTKYAAGWEVVSPAGRGIPVLDWEIHKSGTRYANVGVEGLAKEILRLKRNPKERARMSAAGLIRAQDFQWDRYREKLIPLVEQAIDAHTVSSPKKTGKDSWNDTTKEEAPQDVIGEGTGEEDISGDSDILTRQSETGPR